MAHTGVRTYFKLPYLEQERIRLGQELADCPDCEGEGKCGRCSGSGEVEEECDMGYLHYDKCPDCYTHKPEDKAEIGRCWHCKGVGTRLRTPAELERKMLLIKKGIEGHSSLPM